MRVSRSEDLAYFKNVLLRPGMRKAARGGLSSEIEIDAALKSPDVAFFKVEEGGDPLGFVAFRSHGKFAEIHTCLLTLGARSVQAVRSAIEQFRKTLKIQRIVAVFPTSHKACERMALSLGFVRADAVDITGFDGVPYSFFQLDS